MPGFAGIRTCRGLAIFETGTESAEAAGERSQVVVSMKTRDGANDPRRPKAALWSAAAS
jgi:hypothetical protein